MARRFVVSSLRQIGAAQDERILSHTYTSLAGGPGIRHNRRPSRPAAPLLSLPLGQSACVRPYRTRQKHHGRKDVIRCGPVSDCAAQLRSGFRIPVVPVSSTWPQTDDSRWGENTSLQPPPRTSASQGQTNKVNRACYLNTTVPRLSGRGDGFDNIEPLLATTIIPSSSPSI